MDTDEYQAAYEGRTGADRMALKLAIIPDKLRGDMDEVARLRGVLKQFSECNLSEENCASFDVANKRIRNLAKRALMPNDGTHAPATKKL